MQTEGGAIVTKPLGNPDILIPMIGGLLATVVGFMVLLFGSLGYCNAMSAMRSLNEKAEEMGLGEIPGVNLEDTVRLFLIFILIGSALLAAGVVVVVISAKWTLKTKGS